MLSEIQPLMLENKCISTVRDIEWTDIVICIKIDTINKGGIEEVSTEVVISSL